MTSSCNCPIVKKSTFFIWRNLFHIIVVFFFITVWVFTNERKIFWKKKGCNVPFKLPKGMAKFIITVKNKSRISLVKLVTIISVVSSNKGNHCWSRFFRRVASFGTLPVKFYRYFRGVVTFGNFTIGWVDYLRKSLKTGTSRSALQGNRAQCHYSRLQSSDLVSWSGNVTLYDGLYRKAWHASSWYPF